MRPRHATGLPCWTVCQALVALVVIVPVCLSGAGFHSAQSVGQVLVATFTIVPVCLSVRCRLLWCQFVCQVLAAMFTIVPVCLLGAGCHSAQSVCQVLAAMVPVFLSGAGWYGDCLMSLAFQNSI